jgi:hypothetical protein
MSIPRPLHSQGPKSLLSGFFTALFGSRAGGFPEQVGGVCGPGTAGCSFVSGCSFRAQPGVSGSLTARVPHPAWVRESCYVSSR